MEPVGVTASLITLLNTSTTVIGYLRIVKDASKEQKRLIEEISSVSGTLFSLKDLAGQAESGEAYLETVRSLDVPNGPLVQYKAALERLAARLAPATGLKKAGKALAWPFKKEEVYDILGVIERMKALFTLALQEDHLELARAIKNDITDINDRLKELQVAEIDHRRDEVLRWFFRVDPSLNHHAACKKHEPTTGEWFLQSLEFKCWKSSPSSILWLYGIRYWLCSTIIENIKHYYGSDPTNTFAYFYFDFNDREKQTVTNLLYSVLAQISLNASVLPNAVQKLYSQYGKQPQQPNQRQLSQALFSVLQDGRSYYIILDALDECKEREELLDTLLELAGHGMKNLHILLTSRREREIKDTLEEIVTGSVPLESADVDKDIGIYVRKRLSVDQKLKKWPDSIKIDIEASLVRGAQGMFRWAFCQLETLRRCLKRSALEQALKQLPKTLDETYDRIIRNIPEDRSEEARTLLQWLAFSDRPLSLEEAAEATVMRSESCILDLKEIIQNERLREPDDVLEICSSLITCVTARNSSEEYTSGDNNDIVSQGQKQLRFAHFSVKEYIISERLRNGEASKFWVSDIASHSNIGNFCLSYLLMFDELNSLSSKTPIEFPLLEYSAKTWYKHVKVTEENDLENTTTMSLISKFLSSENFSFANWLRMYEPDRPFDNRAERDVREFAAPLYYVSYVGLAGIAKMILEKNVNVNAQGGRYGNALQAASYRGDEAIVRLLVEKGADVNAQGGEYGNALQAASFCGDEATVRLLLEKGADVNARGGRYGNALQAASFRRDEATVALLVEKGADVNAQGGGYGNALQAASFCGDEATVRLLVEKGADVNAQGGALGNALQAATWRGDEAIVRLLLEKGADHKAQGGQYGNALQAASVRGGEATVRLLVEKGADVNAQGAEYGNALQAASWRGDEAIVRLLVEKGADVNAQGGEYVNALQAASFCGDEATVRLLLEKGADVNAQGGVILWR
ncbi:MAG: hypothetical protein M1816_003625 [Peltula sp. TS41687]|nr:MAG: hypothetical protein M1816_003625 [Peltula sp. TS41687]